MKKLLNEWKKHLKEINQELMKEAINPGNLTRSEIEAKIDREKEKFKAAKAAGDERAAFRASQDMGVYMDDLKGALPDSEEGSVNDQDEAKKPEDQIRDLATELERGLEGDMKKKATEIIGLINVHFSEGTKTPDETGERGVSDEE